MMTLVKKMNVTTKKKTRKNWQRHLKLKKSVSMAELAKSWTMAAATRRRAKMIQTATVLSHGNTCSLEFCRECINFHSFHKICASSRWNILKQKNTQQNKKLICCKGTHTQDRCRADKLLCTQNQLTIVQNGRFSTFIGIETGRHCCIGRERLNLTIIRNDCRL